MGTVGTHKAMYLEQGALCFQAMVAVLIAPFVFSTSYKRRMIVLSSSIVLKS